MFRFKTINNQVFLPTFIINSVILFYISIKIILPILNYILISQVAEFTGIRLCLDIIISTLLIYPFFYANNKFSFYHPFIILTIFEFVNELFQSSDKSFRLFQLLPIYPEKIEHSALSGYTQYEINFAQLKWKFLTFLSLISYYFGYFKYKKVNCNIQIINFTFREFNIKNRLYILALVYIIFFFIYTVIQGGFWGLFQLWEGGRRQLEGLGPLFVLLNTGFYVLLVLYIEYGTKKKPLYFWLMLFFSITIQFLTTGSRGGLIFQSILFFLAFIYVNKRPPLLISLFFGFISVIILGFLGQFRLAMQVAGDIDKVLDMSMLDIFFSFNEEVELRNNFIEGSLPVFAKVPSEVPLLWGYPYLGVLLFFVPRFIWQTKPHGTGYYNTSMIFQSGEYGIPLDSVAESYWNFHVFGVFFVHFLFGLYHRYMFNFSVKNTSSTGFILYLILIFLIKSPSDMLVIPAIQMVSSLLLGLYLFNIVRIRFFK
jgi:oligosaccharide repeat unit polymerase